MNVELRMPKHPKNTKGTKSGIRSVRSRFWMKEYLASLIAMKVWAMTAATESATVKSRNTAAYSGC